MEEAKDVVGTIGPKGVETDGAPTGPPRNNDKITSLPSDDREFLDTKSRGAQLTPSGWVIETEYGNLAAPLTRERMPVPGINIRLYGVTEETVHAGSAIRGVVIGDEVSYYRTAEEQKQASEEAIAAALEEKKQAYEEGGLKERLDADYESLPPLFQRRIDRFRTNNPDFRWKWETYEMAAVKLAA
ncbi:MAG: hypothetical protein CMJ75_18935, partial [Planctomycetaceae bacterium]|nr:hypothetical protein [Planctomycetaceae bacterium]